MRVTERAAGAHPPERLEGAACRLPHAKAAKSEGTGDLRAFLDHLVTGALKRLKNTTPSWCKEDGFLNAQRVRRLHLTAMAICTTLYPNL